MSLKSSTPKATLTLLIIGFSGIIFASNPLMSSIQAQSSPRIKDTVKIKDELLLPAGTLIPVKYQSAKKILLTKEETMKLSLQVANNITNVDGKVIIPDGSEIVGEIKPSRSGSQFFSQKILLKLNNQTSVEKSLDAISQIINKIETLVSGINADQITQDAILSPMATKLIKAFREQSRSPGRILGVSDLEALSGWLLDSETLSLIAINPEQDLQLTLQSDLILTMNHEP